MLAKVCASLPMKSCLWLCKLFASPGFRCASVVSEGGWRVLLHVLREEGVGVCVWPLSARECGWLCVPVSFHGVGVAFLLPPPRCVKHVNGQPRNQRVPSVKSRRPVSTTALPTPNNLWARTQRREGPESAARQRLRLTWQMVPSINSLSLERNPPPPPPPPPPPSTVRWAMRKRSRVEPSNHGPGTTQCEAGQLT